MAKFLVIILRIGRKFCENNSRHNFGFPQDFLFDKLEERIELITKNEMAGNLAEKTEIL